MVIVPYPTGSPIFYSVLSKKMLAHKYIINLGTLELTYNNYQVYSYCLML